MENGNGGGNIGAGDAAVLALLADTSRAGRGGWGEGYGCGGPYATPSSIQHSIGCARDQIGQQANMQGQVAAQQALLQAIAAVGQNVTQSEARAVSIIRDIDLNTLRESADLSRQINACCCETQKGFLEQALKAQECCCETQKTVLEDGQKTRDLINANALRVATDQNNVNATVGAINGAASVNTAAIVAAIRETCARPPHPHPC